MLQSVKATSGSLEYQGIVLVLTLSVAVVSPQAWLAPGSLATILLFLALLVLLCLANIRLLMIQGALRKEPWSYHENLQRFFIATVSGFIAAATALFARDLIVLITRLALPTGTIAPGLAFAACIVLTLVIIGMPGYQFFQVTHRYHSLRVAEKLLERLDQRYNEHLLHLLPNPETSFPLDVSATPDALQPLLVPGQPLSPVSSLSPVSPRVRVALDAPASQPATPAEVTHTQLWQRFDDASGQRQLLILAESGGGKSTQLYLLARTLIAEARAMLNLMRRAVAANKPLPEGMAGLDETAGISQSRTLRFPVIIDVSLLDPGFDASPNNALNDWQVEALVKVYGLGRRVANQWVGAGRVVQLLDSLDVLGEKKRERCIERVNTYLALNQHAQIAVGFGAAEYQATEGPRLALRQAATLRPLAPATVMRELPGARQADGSEREALRSPMALSLALASSPQYQAYETYQTYQAQDTAPATAADDAATSWHMAVCRGYVRGLLGSGSNGSPGQAEKTLAWLGYQLRRRQKLVFHLEELQRDWLPSPFDIYRYRRSVRRMKALITLVAGLIFGAVVAWTVSMVFAIGNGQAVKALLGTGAGIGIAPASMLIAGTVGGIGVGLGIAKTIRSGAEIKLLHHVYPTWGMQRRLVNLAAVIGVLAAIDSALIGGPGLVPVGALIIGLGAALGAGLLIAWCGRLPMEHSPFSPPNKGFPNSIKSALVTLLVFTVAGLLIGGLIVTTLLQPMIGMNRASHFVLSTIAIGAVVVALSLLAFVGLNVAFRNGGASVLQHILLRRALRQSQIVPPKLVHYLDALRARGLLRREGDGYSFILRSPILRDYFAAEYETTFAVEYARRLPPPPLHTRIGRRAMRILRSLAPKRPPHWFHHFQRKPLPGA